MLFSFLRLFLIPLSFACSDAISSRMPLKVFQLRNEGIDAQGYAFRVAGHGFFDQVVLHHFGQLRAGYVERSFGGRRYEIEFYMWAMGAMISRV
jgi:hypothetical protein